MTQQNHSSLDQHRTAAGVHRKALERAVASAIRQWHEGADGNVLIGKIEQQFFPVQPGRHEMSKSEGRGDDQGKVERREASGEEGNGRVRTGAGEASNKTGQGQNVGDRISS